MQGGVYWRFSIDVLFHDPVLKYTHGLQDVQDSCVVLVYSGNDETDDNLFPRRGITSTEGRRFATTNRLNILHYPMNRPGYRCLVFLQSIRKTSKLVHCNN